MRAKQPRPWFRRDSGRDRGWFVTIEGKQVSLGVADPLAVGAALEALSKLLAQGTGGRSAVGEKVPLYLDAVRHRMQLASSRKVGYSLKWLTTHFGTVSLGDLDPLAVEARAAGEKWSDSHRSNVLYDVQAFVRWAGIVGFTLRRPSKDSRASDPVISPELFARILRETTGDFHQYVRCLWHTGARPEEIATLAVEGIDWANGCSTLKRHKTKGKGKTRLLVFGPEALAVLVEQRAKHPSGFLFRGQKHERLTRRGVVGRFLRLSDKLGVSVCAYQFRRTFVTRALESGIPDTTVAALVGHVNTNMIHKHYSSVAQNGRLLRDVMTKLDKPGEAA